MAEWTVPYAQLAADWNFFALPRACGGAARTLRLRISTTGTETVGLSLGYPIASERYTARSETPHPDLDLRPLAFRVFTGLPGVKPTRMRVLVTGGAGFIGSAVCRHLIQRGAERVVNVDKLTYAGSLASLQAVEGNPRYAFYRADIRDEQVLLQIM